MMSEAGGRPKAERWDQLAAFLEDWQSRRHRPVTIEQRMLVYAVFEQASDAAPEDIGDQIGPLLCTSAEEQSEFRDQWALFRRGSGVRTDTAVMASGAAQAARDSWLDRANRAWRRRRRWVVAIMTVLTLAVWLAGIWWLRPPSPPPLATQTDTPNSTQNGSPITATDDSSPSAVPVLKTVPLRQPPPSLSLSTRDRLRLEQIRNVVLAATLGLLLCLAGLLWWLHQIMIRRVDQRHPSEELLHTHLPTRGLEQTLLPQLHQILGRWRFQTAGHERIDWPKSVQASARQLGYPVLIGKPRPRAVDVVLVIDARHARDQTAWLLRHVRDELRRASVAVHYYDFDHHPEHVWRDGDRTRTPLPLAQLSALHPDAALLLVVEHEVLFLRISGRMQTWLQHLAEWPQYLLALLSHPSLAEQESLQQAGHRYRLLDQQTDVSQLLEQMLAESKRAEPPAALPKALTVTDEYIEEDSEQVAQQMTALHDYLGESGLRLLAGIAMYPKLHGPLSLAVYHWLAEHDQAAHEPALLLKIAALPWCRQGWLPQWLRRALLRQLPDDDYQNLHQFYRELFQPDGKTLQKVGIQLEFARPEPFRFRSWLRTAISRARYNSPLRDQIFAQVLLNPRRWRDELILPRASARVLPPGALQFGRAGLKLAAVGVLVMTSVYGFWQVWGEAQLSPWVIAQRQAQYAEQTVLIRYAPGAAALVAPLSSGLAALGFQVQGEENAEVSANRVQAPAALATELQTLARRMSWDAEFPVSTEDVTPVIELAAPLVTGGVFRDRLATDVTLAGEYPAQSPLVSTSSAPPSPPVQPVQPAIDPNVEPILPTMVPIPAGTFLMGSPADEEGRFDNEGPQHQVTLVAFEMAETELTFAEWDRCVQAGACREVDDEGWGREDRPVINVSWDDTQVYIDWLNQALGLSGANRYRLPSEAEWEYAARAGTTTAYYWGDESRCDYENIIEFLGNSTDCDDGYDSRSAPVKQFKPNAWGLYDMPGNVWEWVEDCWHGNYENAPSDGAPWLEENEGDCDRRTLRGCSWCDFPRLLRSAYRIWGARVVANNIAGFRLARTL